MFGTEHKNTDERLSNRVYVEKALREAATVTGTPSAKPAQTEMATCSKNTSVSSITQGGIDVLPRNR